MPTTISITVSDDTHRELVKAKGERTWAQAIKEELT